MEVDGHGQRCCCYKWFVRSCAVFVLTCCIGLSCCAYCAYIVHNASKVFSLSNFNQAGYDRQPITEDVVYNDATGNIEYVRDQQHTRLKRDDIIVNFHKRHPSDHTEGNKKGRKQKNKKRREGKKKGRRRNKLMATHYVLSAGIDDPGASCPIPTGTSPHRMSHLNQFTPAAFVQDNTNPFRQIEGKFFVQEKGLYLVYAQVLFEDCREDQIMVVAQKRHDTVIQEHFCIVGVSKSVAKYNNTCSITALFYMESGDFIAMTNYYPEVHINYRSYNSTFIGAVLLK